MNADSVSDLWRGRIILDPKILAGKPIVKGTRLSVDLIVELIARGWSVERLIDNYPKLEEADIRACLAYACEIMRDEAFYPLAG